jgi:hypothetical protein
MKIRAALVPLLLFTFFLPLAWAAPWQVTESVEGEIPLIVNPGLPRDGAIEVTATEQWRLGADEENDPLLGRITDVITDTEGNAYLLDGNLSDIHVVDTSGEILRTIGGEGDGPGEIRNASELSFMPNGDIGVMEMMPGKIVVMDPFGEPRDSFRPADENGGHGMMLPQHFAADEHGVILGHVSTNFGHDGVVTEFMLGRYSLDGTLIKALAEHREEQSGGNVSLSLGDGEDDFAADWVVCHDGRVVGYRYAYDYELQVYGPDGNPVMLVRREYETLRKPEAELAADKRRAEENNSRFSGVTIEVEERSRDISAVHARPDGHLWVATSEGARNRTEGSLEVFDVYDESGHFVNTVNVTGVEYNPARDEYVIDGDRLYIFRESRMVPPKTTTSGGGGMQMIMISGSGPDPADEEDSGPLEVICYVIAD